MAKTVTRTIVVEGSGRFPFDMLRYDRCWPRTEQDSYKLSFEHDAEKRTVELLTNVSHGPTGGRWHSQGWRVIDSKKIEL